MRDFILSIFGGIGWILLRYVLHKVVDKGPVIQLEVLPRQLVTKVEDS